MKRVLAYLLVSVLILSLAACGGGGTSSSDKMYDDDFISALKSGLTARWNYADTNTDEEKMALEKATNLELEKIAEYKNLPFENTNLQEKAISYINELNNSLDVLSSYGADAFNADWSAHKDRRKKLITEINDIYPLEFDEKYQSTLNEFLSRGQEVAGEEKKAEAAEQLAQNLVFEQIEPDYPDATYISYEGIAENTSEYDFDSFNVIIDLIDEDGVTLDTCYCYINGWTAGKRVKVDFMTDAQFKTMEVRLDSYY